MANQTNNFDRATALMGAVDNIHVETPQATIFREVCERLMERSKKVKFPGGLIVKGASGTGKTHLVERFLINHMPFDDDYKRNVPVLTIDLKSSPTSASIAKSILNQLGYPFDPNDSADDLIEPVCNAFDSVGLMLFIIDEGQHPFEGAKKNSAITVCDWLKLVHSESKVPIAILGTERIYRMSEISEQLVQRLPARLNLSRLAGREYAGMYKGFLSVLPVKIDKSLDTETMSNSVLKSCGGSRRKFKMLFGEAVFQLINKGGAVLTKHDLSSAHNLLFDATENPF